MHTQCVSGPVPAVRNAVMETVYPQGTQALDRNTKITTNLVFRFPVQGQGSQKGFQLSTLITAPITKISKSQYASFKQQKLLSLFLYSNALFFPLILNFSTISWHFRQLLFSPFQSNQYMNMLNSKKKKKKTLQCKCIFHWQPWAQSFGFT